MRKHRSQERIVINFAINFSAIIFLFVFLSYAFILRRTRSSSSVQLKRVVHLDHWSHGGNEQAPRTMGGPRGHFTWSVSFSLSVTRFGFYVNHLVFINFMHGVQFINLFPASLTECRKFLQKNIPQWKVVDLWLYFMRNTSVDNVNCTHNQLYYNILTHK